MKKRFRVVSLLFIMLLTFSVSGCSKEEDITKELVGRWTMECDFTESLKTEQDEAYFEADAPFIVKVVLELSEEGTFKMYLDKDSFSNSLEQWLDKCLASQEAQLYEILAQKGLTKEDVDQIVQEQYGSSLTECLRGNIQSELSIVNTIERMQSEGIYDVKDSQLYMTNGQEIDENSYYSYILDENTLTLNLPEGVVETVTLPGIEYPLIFTKENK